MRLQSYHQVGCEQLMTTVSRLVKTEYLDCATVRAVFTKNNAGNWEYLVGKCELGDVSGNNDSETYYSNYAFICKSLTDFNLKEFLGALEEGGYVIAENMQPILTTPLCQDSCRLT